ncbi:MAG: T9SS type A sorting domain-containing protein, partial [Bacteroidales bacterium]|nr:T9SS type A sorting domain-containing protein [Bacteroidales bacterium]MCF8338176.1 T9SS type A sorting domain-containing protein [Bacteroidales bacterium]
YPNPASDRITVDSDGFNDARMVVYSNTGVEVYGSQMEGNKTTFELPELGSGVYTVRFYDQKEQIAVRKLVIQ